MATPPKLTQAKALLAVLSSASMSRRKREYWKSKALVSFNYPTVIHDEYRIGFNIISSQLIKSVADGGEFYDSMSTSVRILSSVAAEPIVKTSIDDGMSTLLTILSSTLISTTKTVATSEQYSKNIHPISSTLVKSVIPTSPINDSHTKLIQILSSNLEAI